MFPYLFSVAGVTQTTPVYPTVPPIGIGPGFALTLLTYGSVLVLHTHIYVAYIGTSKMVNYVVKTI